MLRTKKTNLFFFQKTSAKDGDVDREQNLVYFLTGQGIDDKNPSKSKFSINSTTGEIYVNKPLDRDLPHGRSQWRFTGNEFISLLFGLFLTFFLSSFS